MEKSVSLRYKPGREEDEANDRGVKLRARFLTFCVVVACVEWDAVGQLNGWVKG